MNCNSNENNLITFKIGAEKEQPICKKNILYVDDDLCFLNLTKTILESDGEYLIDCASNVDEALNKLSTGNYVAVISDYEMPIKNGLDLLLNLREQKNDIAFVLFTGKGREELAVKALNLGADGYVNKQGNPETVYGELEHVIENSIEKTESKKKLAEARLFTHKIIDSTPNIVYIYDLFENKYIYSNKEAAKFLGYSPEQISEMGSESFISLLHPEDVKIITAHYARFTNALENEVFEVEYRIRHADGEWHWFRSYDILFSRTARGTGKQILGTCQDITKEKNAALKLTEKFQLLESVGENIDAGLAIIDKNYDIIWCNKVLANAGAIPNQKCFNTIAKLNEVCPGCGVKKVFEENIPLDTHEYMTINSEGKKNWVEIRATPLKDSEGKITSVLELAVPITEHKKAELEFEQLLQRYQQANKALSCLYDISLMIEKPNTSLEDVMKRTNELLPKTLQYPESACSKITFENQQYLTHNFQQSSWRYQANISSFEKNVGCIEVYYLEKKDIIYFDGPFLKEERFLIDAVAERLGRVVERKENERRVAFQVNLLNSVGQSVIMVDENRKIRFWNKGAENLYGWTETEVAGKDIIEITGAEENANPKTVIKRLKSGVSWDTEAKVINKEGVPVPVIVNHSPLFDEKGKYSGAVSVVTNISELKQTQRDLTIALEALSCTIENSELLNEKLRVVGGLTRHDVRNKLSGIAGYSYILRKKHKEQPVIVEALDQIDRAIQNINRIFNFAKMYEQLGLESLSPIDAGVAVDDAIKLFSSNQSFRIINRCHGLCLLADSFLVQLFYNLLDNTRKYGQKASEVKISYNKNYDENITLIYEDNGVGISLKDKPFLFKEGYSTGGSTGLGLFFIKRMLDIYGWKIQETGSSEGAKFEIIIPKVNKKGIENCCQNTENTSELKS